MKKEYYVGLDVRKETIAMTRTWFGSRDLIPQARHFKTRVLPELCFG
ncbi:MAG: hypothetical protein HRU46_11040 [Verrucomicrobiales bacterium]|nr:hypothetical protein [Verrucomicrobiales bacterium]